MTEDREQSNHKVFLSSNDSSLIVNGLNIMAMTCGHRLSSHAHSLVIQKMIDDGIEPALIRDSLQAAFSWLEFVNKGVQDMGINPINKP